MAKIIRMTDEVRAAALEDFAKQLESAQLTGNGEFKYSKTFSYAAKMKATVVYTAKAWFKTIMIVEDQPKEVGWYGVCRRDEDDPTRFLIDDIYVYPQAVTGSTINPDDVKFSAWENSLDDDTFNNLRFHGHSHVNMGVFSSGTDEEFRRKRLTQLEDDEFFIFQVFNKRGEIHSAIYDYRENVRYENNEVETRVICSDMAVWDKYKKIAKALSGISIEDMCDCIAMMDSCGITAFLSNADALIEEDRAYRPYKGGSYQNGGYGGSYQGGGQGGYYSGGYHGGGYSGGYSSGGYKDYRPGGTKQLQSVPPASTKETESSDSYDEDLTDFTPEQLEIIHDPLGWSDGYTSSQSEK